MRDTRAIVVADNARRLRLTALELARMSDEQLQDYYGNVTERHNKHAMVIRADARMMSAVTALDIRVSERWKATCDRAIGTVDNLPTPSVAIYKDGVRTVRTVSSFRTRVVTARNAKTSNRTTTHTKSLHESECASQAPIGNVE